MRGGGGLGGGRGGAGNGPLRAGLAPGGPVPAAHPRGRSLCPLLPGLLPVSPHPPRARPSRRRQAAAGRGCACFPWIGRKGGWAGEGGQRRQSGGRVGTGIIPLPPRWGMGGVVGGGRVTVRDKGYPQAVKMVSRTYSTVHTARRWGRAQETSTSRRLDRGGHGGAGRGGAGRRAGAALNGPRNGIDRQWVEWAHAPIGPVGGGRPGTAVTATPRPAPLLLFSFPGTTTLPAR